MLTKHIPISVTTGAAVFGAQYLSAVANKVTTIPMSVQVGNAGAVAGITLAVDTLSPAQLGILWRSLIIGGVTAGAMSVLRGDKTPLQMGVWFGVSGGSHFLSHLALDMMDLDGESD